MSQSEQFVNWLTNQPIALTEATNSIFGGSGASHSIGLVPDPGGSFGINRFLREDSTWSPTTVAAVVQDTNYNIKNSDQLIIIFPAFTAPRTWTLPSPATTPPGHVFTIVGVPGSLTSTNTLTIQRNAAETIIMPNNTGQTSFTVSDPCTTFSIASDSVNWFVLGNSFASGVLVAALIYNGSQTITIPFQATKADITMWGATGGSGGVNNGESGGSGAGGYLRKLLSGLGPGNTIVYTQAAGGTAGTNAPGAGGNAGATTLASGSQGITTLTCNGSNGTAAANATYSPGTAGATATNGDLNITGQAGTAGIHAANRDTNAPGGRNVYSVGANGNVNAGAAAGFVGSSGGLMIFWYV